VFVVENISHIINIMDEMGRRFRSLAGRIAKRRCSRGGLWATI